MRTRKKQILERQGEVLLLRGWKSLKFGAEPSDAIGPGAGFPAICEGIELSIETPPNTPEMLRSDRPKPPTRSSNYTVAPPLHLRIAYGGATEV